MSEKSITDTVFSFVHSIISRKFSVVAGVSGGCDSIALLFILHHLREKLGISRMVVAHCNHGLRGEDSDNDELLVRQCAESLGLAFFVRRLSGHRIDEPGLEEWAREQRYLFFGEVRDSERCDYIATGHTMDDQAETVLMRIIRGSGLNGMRGITPLREDGIIRPLLNIRKEELAGWLHDHGYRYREDASNDDCRFFRNRIRHTLLPQLEIHCSGAVRHLAALASEAQDLWNERVPLVEKWLACYFSVSDKLFIVETSLKVQREVAAEGVRRILDRNGIVPTRYHIDKVLDCAGGSGGTVLLPAGWRCRGGSSRLYFEKQPPSFFRTVPVSGKIVCEVERRQMTLTVVPELPEQLDRGKWTVFVDGSALGEQCVYRTVTSDDMFVPFGKKQEVPVWNFLKKQGLNRPDREYAAALFSADNKLIWIPGIRLDERFRISSGTKKVIKVQSERFS